MAGAGETEFVEEIGDSHEYKLRLKELWSKRTQLMKVKKKKPKKKSRNKSALKKTMTSNEEQTNWDGETSAMTMTYGELKQTEQEVFNIIDDTTKLQ